MAKKNEKKKTIVKKATGLVGKEMGKEELIEYIGGTAFIVGFTITIILGFFSSIVPLAVSAIISPFIFGILVLFGFIVGAVNINDKKTETYLISAIALLVMASAFSEMGDYLDTAFDAAFNFQMNISASIGSFLNAIKAFVAPTVLLVSLKNIYNIASSDKSILTITK